MSTISSICYHYIARDDEFSEILGHSFELFKEHINFLKKNYDVIDPQDLLNQKFEDDKKYMLLTFDDGLKENVQMADYLDEVGVKGVFAIPSCILRGEMPNPQIIHFGLAFYGLEKFYDFVSEDINDNFIEYSNLLPNDSGKTTKNLKKLFKFDLDYHLSRRVLLSIFKNKLQKDFPNIMDLVHLNKEEIVGLVKNGHTIAVHTDTHPVIKDIGIGQNEELMHREIVQAKKDLEDLVGQGINIFAYPFGAKTEILTSTDYLTKNNYKLIMTTFKNQEDFDILELGRYCTFSKDTTDDLNDNLWNYNIKE